MSLTEHDAEFDEFRFPRVSGDEPPRRFMPSLLAAFSPRERG